VLVIEVVVIKKLGGEHHAGDYEPVDVQLVQHHFPLCYQAINVNEGKDKTLVL